MGPGFRRECDLIITFLTVLTVSQSYRQYGHFQIGLPLLGNP